MSDIETNELLDETAEKTVYEASFLLDANLTEEEAAKKQEAFKTWLTERGAEIISEGTPESKKLAYTIEVKRDSKRKDHTKAHFSWIKFDLAANAISDLDTLLRNDEHMVRYLIVKTVREDTMYTELSGELDENGEPLEDSEADAPAVEEETEEAVV